MTRLEPGDPAPDFALSDADGNTVRLADFRKRKVVVYFYPAAMTPGCTVEACDFRDSLSVLSVGGTDVLGVSPDPLDRLVKFREKEQLNFPLLSDPDHAVMERYGAWGEKNQYGRRMVGVIRSTFVVGPEGRLEQVQYGVRASGHVSRLLITLGADRAG